MLCYRNRMRIRIAPLSRGLPAGLAYGALWLALWQISQSYWFLPAGLRFGVLLLAPLELWPWLIGGEWAAALLLNTTLRPVPGAALLLVSLPPPLAVAAVIALLRRFGLRASIDLPEDLARILAAALLAAVTVTALNAGFIAKLAPTPSASLPYALANLVLGDYVGILLIAPLLVMLLRAPPGEQAGLRMLADVLWFLLPVIALLLLAMGGSEPLARYARILALVPVMFFAFRHGWRGASIAMLAASTAVTLRAATAVDPNAPAEAQLFLAVAGTGALLLGAATDALRRSGERLALQNARLEGANHRLDQLAQQLASAARRNLREEEEERRRIAGELHDELGQNLTAIQTRVKLAQGRLQEAGLGDVAAAINEILAGMRRSVRGLLESLRPVALDEFGLARALEDGPVRDLLRSAGIRYRLELHGNLRVLDDDTGTTVYRIVQEAATNTVRHAHARQFEVRLRVGRHGDALLVLLDLRDDGVGLSMVPGRGGGRGLQGMRDRVLALGGLFRLRQEPRGARLRVLLRQPLNHLVGEAVGGLG